MARYVDKLEEEGIAAPASTPVVFYCGADRVVAHDVIDVAGEETCGEVEFVLLLTEEGLHVTVGSDHTDRALETKGLTRRIAVRVPTFYAALSIVAHSDLVLTGPTPLRRLGAGLPPIATLTPPLPLPDHALDLLWHERFAKDPAHAWLRTTISDVVRDVLR